ncbi:CRISPR-associated endonuclease Cas3'' [Nocardia sp. 2TAF39]|uniref:CRISPR-associated endonuclease Cas3'' n=1 Tax=Nocardia sp. 2TAF39 TaxID=3233017 RepID=UPI003F962D16
MQDLIDLRLWGKSRGLDVPYPLVCHLLDAGAGVGVLWDRCLSAGVRRFVAAGLGVGELEARALLVFWAGLHDIGKVMACFQAQDAGAFGAGGEYPAAVGGRKRHDYAAHVWLRSALVELKFGARAAETVAQLLGGHHGCFYALDTRAAADPLVMVPELGVGEWERQRRALVAVVHQVAGSPEPVRRVSRAAAGIVCGVIMLADWLVSQTGFLRARSASVPARGDLRSLREHFDGSMREVPGLLRQAGLGELRLRPGSFADEHGFAPNELQRSVEQMLPSLVSPRGGLLLVTAPMGVGKTETALTGARVLGDAAGAPGSFFGLPTMATADPMYSRLSEYGNRRAAGSAPLALLHSMAWMNSAYQRGGTGDVVTGEDPDDAVGDVAVLISEWLRGPKRGLLAPWATGTVDQALLASVRGRHNMVRMLGLVGKVLIVDEVHAYDAYMQQLLRRLLEWLGAVGVPVVLLSATVPEQVARRLVQSYLHGAGHELGGEMEFCYPGWLHADAGSGAVRSFAVRCPQSTLSVGLSRVDVDSEGGCDLGPAVRRLLTPLVGSGRGCVGIICNTVAEAQQTYRDLGEWFGEIRDGGGPVPELTLLHSRFPVDRREEITTNIVAAYGKNGSRPWGVVVATQVIEQSIDLDFDLIISDLAPVALLLQRAGRGYRHAGNPRPDWAGGPRLEVLVPTSSGGVLTLPRSWPYVYPKALLRRTFELLVDRDREGTPIRIPQDVQAVMEVVYDQSFADGTMAADDIENLADEQVKAALADMVVIPGPGQIADLYALTDRELDDALFTTRLGADSGRVVCCFVDAEGRRWLGADHTVAFPERGLGPHGRLTDEQVKAVLAKSIPVPGTWMRGPMPENLPPAAWDKNPYLRKLLVLMAYEGAGGAMRLGSRTCELSNELGLSS